ncbi:DUF2189 domain-containing protein [Devosia sp.]|uniref:DUF2189 domain-containing protein n=1 Tax=Devosia sp. TaxID=1871048 RepID=UPI003A8DB4EE
MFGSQIVRAGGQFVLPETRRLRFDDVLLAIRSGVKDFGRTSSHVIVLSLLYTLVAVLLVVWTSGNNAWPLVYPLITGFAFLGPLAALPLYELSRRLSKGEPPSLAAALQVFSTRSLASIMLVGLVLLVLFTAWLTVAQALYVLSFGVAAPHSMSAFLNQLLFTANGRDLIVFGNLVALALAIVVLAISFVTVPLLLDQDVGAAVAVMISIRMTMRNPVVALTWGLIVAISLLIGAAILVVGLAVVIPILGHASWHLYQRAMIAETPNSR